MATLFVIACLLLALTAAVLGYWLTVAYRVRRMMRSRPTIRTGLDLPPPDG